MLQTEALPPRYADAAHQLFGDTAPIVGMVDYEPRVFTVQNVIRNILENGLLVYGMAPTSPANVPYSADLFQRGFYDINDEEVADLVKKQVPRTKQDLNHIRANFDDTSVAFGTAIELGFLTYTAVLYRPEGLTVPQRDGQIHESELGELRGNHYAIVHRHKTNFMRNVAKRAVMSVREFQSLRALQLTVGNAVNIDRTIDTINNQPERVPERTLRLLTRVSLAGFAQRLLPLFTADPEAAAQLKKYFLDESFAIIDKSPLFEKLTEGILVASVSDVAANHILRGDARGGGHHLPSLDSKYSRIVGPVVYLSETNGGRDIRVPVARQQRFDGKGRLIDDRVTSFFPSEWSAQEVLDAICYPNRLAYMKNTGDDWIPHDMVYHKGLLIKRVYAETDEENESLVTAHPSVVIPRDLERSLKPSDATFGHEVRR